MEFCFFQSLHRLPTLGCLLMMSKSHWVRVSSPPISQQLFPGAVLVLVLRHPSLRGASGRSQQVGILWLLVSSEQASADGF